MKPRHYAEDLPGEYENFLSLQVREDERVTAVNGLADIYRSLGVITQAEALAEIGRLKGNERPGVEWG